MKNPFPDPSEIRRFEVLEKKPEIEIESDPEPEVQVIDALVQALKIHEPVVETPSSTQNDASKPQETPANVKETNEEEFDTPLIHHLVIMGFEKSKIKKAVEKYTDLESALNHLLDEN